MGEGGHQRLLDREVEHRFLLRRQLDRTLTQPSDRLGHGQCASPPVAGEVAVHTDRGDEADSFLVAATHLGAKHAGRDHPEVTVGLEATEGERVAAGNNDERVSPR